LIGENLIAWLGRDPDTPTIIDPSGNSPVPSHLRIVLALISRIAGELFKPKKCLERGGSVASKSVLEYVSEFNAQQKSRKAAD
jgi:hypothetical protein